MPKLPNQRLGHYLLLLATSVALFLINLGGPSLWDIDEGRNATAALEMRESRDWIKPTFNGELRSHKPALLYWLQAAAYELFGVNEFAARLPSALAAMLTVLLVYEFGRSMFNPPTGLVAALVIASSILFSASAHFANPDALLLAFTTATLLLFWLGIAKECRGCLLLAGLTAGMAVLAKGPVGLVAPAAAGALFLLWTRRWRMLLSRVWLVPLMLCALVALPWYVLVALQTRLEFLADFLLVHNLGRALHSLEDHSGPPWYYLAVLAIGLVPWSAFLGSAMWYGAREAFGRGNARPVMPPEPPAAACNDAYRFLWCWIAVYLLLFTLAATKLPNYILPVFPPCALLIADFLERWRRGVLVPAAWLQLTSVAMLALMGLLTVISLLIVSGVMPPGLPHGRAYPGLETWSVLGAIPIVGAAVAGWCLYRQRRTAFVAVICVAAICFLGPLAAGGSAALDSFRAPRPLVEQAGAFQRDQEIRVGAFELEFLPSLNFYVQRNVQHLQCPEDAIEFLRQPLTVFLFLPRQEWQQLALRVPVPCRIVARNREMYRAGEVVVVTNR